MKFTDTPITPIKHKTLQYTKDKFTYHVKIVYSESKFGYGEKAFWETVLYKVNDKLLTPPLEYRYVQNRGWINQNKKFREHSFHCSARRKILENRTNLFYIVRDQVVYQYTNRKVILKYESKVNNFKFFVELKYRSKLEALKIQKKQLKLKLKSGEIDNREYQRLYTPIRIERDNVEHHIWDICYRYRKRYFSCDRLKEIYR